MFNYKGLAIAILRQAAQDYQTALRNNDAERVAYFEQWFVSDYSQLLSDDMGEIIILRCKKQVEGE